MVESFSVLIVEDEALFALSLKRDLERNGIKVLGSVRSGEEAIEAALRDNPSLILMDIRLAGKLDGVETAELILKKKAIPVIFITGYSSKQTRADALKQNPVDYIEKPMDFSRLMQTISRLIAQ